MSSGIFLVRHGETDWNQESRFRGRVDIPLNDNGLEQAKKVGQALKDVPLAAVYCSPLSRALQTAEEIASIHDLHLQEHEGFNDMDFGEWQGLSGSEVRLRYPKEFRMWVDTPQKVKPPEGESLLEVRKRCWPALEKLASRHRNEIIAIISHQVIIKSLLLSVLGLGESHFWRLEQDPCSINVLRYHSSGNLMISCINETCHLYPLPKKYG